MTTVITNDNDASFRLNTRDKTVPWYKADIGEIPESARELLEKYSGISPDRVVSHVYKIVSRGTCTFNVVRPLGRCYSDTIYQRDLAWEIEPYPCIGGGVFLKLGISLSSNYRQLISRVQNGELLLDVGCCLGQDIRKIVFDGAPSENIYGTDLLGGLMEAGYELFLDRETLRSTFLAADIFEPSSALKQLEGRMDIIYAGSFLHLFDWDHQVLIAKRLVALSTPKDGSVVVGQGFGHLYADVYPVGLDTSRTMFKHNPESFERMWKQVGEETGTTWRVEANLEVMSWAGFTKAGKWGDPDSRLLRFSVHRG